MDGWAVTSACGSQPSLFADIKGSTELEQDLDPEEACAISTLH
jgi:hypothetical protein